jgi:hypothetical protein
MTETVTESDVFDQELEAVEHSVGEISELEDQAKVEAFENVANRLERLLN